MSPHAFPVRLALSAAVALMLTACSGAPEAPAPEASGPSEVAVASATPPAVFGRCASCHTVGEGGANRIGPNLWGTYGQLAADHAGFAYSAALKDAGLTWDDATLDKWLEDPRALVPGTRMAFPGMKDPAERKEVIDYLKTLR